MGQQQTALQKCVLDVVGGNRALIATPSTPLYKFNHVRPYNLEFDDIEPLGIVYPETVEQVSGIMKCAAEADVKVQARGGGHGFGDHCA